MFEVRRVGADEWPTVRKLRLEALRDAPDWFWATYDDEVQKPERWWRTFVESGIWLAAYEAEKAIGIVAALRAPELADSDRQVISMWVAPSARGRGVGKELIEAVKIATRGEGARYLQLEVTDANDAGRRLYQRCGFQITGREQPHPRDPSLHEVEMRLAI